MPLYGPTVATLHHVSHEPLGSDEIMNINASHLTSGVVPDVRLSANVQMKPLPSLVETYITQNVEATLLNSRRLIAGTNITFNTGTAGQLIINSTASGGGAVGLHQTTHQKGGTDELLNNAWLNQNQTFTGINDFTIQITIRATSPGINLVETDRIVGQKNWQLIAENSIFSISANNDSWDLLATPLSCYRDGTVLIQSGLTVNGAPALTVNGDANISGSGGNVACKDQANVFIQDQKISKSVPRMKLVDTSQPTDKRHFEITNFNQTLYLQAMNDAETASMGRITIDRYGTIIASGDFYEKNRTTPLGHWVSGISYLTPYGWAGSYYYSLSGKTLHIVIDMNGTGGGMQPFIALDIPFAATVAHRSPCIYWIGSGAWLTGTITTSAGSAVIAIYSNTGAAFPTGTLYFVINIAIIV